jgi:hypothetical protein
MEWNVDRVIGILGLLLGVLALALGLGVGVAMDAKTTGELWFVRGCFIFSAFVLLVPIALWGIKSEVALVRRCLVVGLGFAMIGVPFLEGMKWANDRHRKAQDVPSASPAFSPTPAPSVDTDKLARELAEKLKASHQPPRAHLHITKFEWSAPTDDGGHAEVKVIFGNNGNLPTKKILFAGRCAWYVTSDGSQIAGMRTIEQNAFENKIYSHAPTATKDLINSADNEMPVGVDRSFTIRSSPWAQSAIDAFREGRGVVYAVGVITYSDEHSTQHTKFCAFVGADGNMKFCGKWNEEP